MLQIGNLENWNEVIKGLYRFVLSAGACYEIHILYHEHDTDITKAKASLYVVGDWKGEDKTFFERDCLTCGDTVENCLKEAEKDYKENISEN